jgi:universal stress protein E
MGKILIIADLEGSCVATSRGLELARKLGHAAEVVAFTYASLPRLSSDKTEQEAIKRELLDKRELTLRERVDKFSEPGQKVSMRVVWMKDIHNWVVKRASSVDFEAVVKTGHLSGSLTYTSTDWHLLRECPAPVLITAEKKWHRTRPVLATLDLASTGKAKRALDDLVLSRAKALAEALEVELRIISAIEIPGLLNDLDLVDPESYTLKHREDMLPNIRQLAQKHDIPEKEFRSKRGPVAKVITSEAARVRAQLVVMGTVGRSGLKAKVIGNTAETVLQHMNTDVLALKPGNARAR